MIFEKVVLHNFGAYRGEHSIVLEVTPERPIVVVGALNGSGKTTLLDAMQLALYGKGARCSGRDRLAYPDYLESTMNRDAKNGDQSGIEFSFRARTGGQDSTIQVARTWVKRGASIKENLEIYRNGNVDSVASERWAEFVEDLMPSQIADLFFFDGEKIEGLADPQRSSSLLKVGIHSLLGLDLVDSLIKSLQVLERKKKTATVADVDREKLDALEEEKKVVQSSLEDALQKRGAHQVQLDSLSKAETAANEHFKRVGGELFLRRQQVDEEKKRLDKQQQEIIGKLLELAAGSLPLVMTKNVVEAVLKRAKQSRIAQDFDLLAKELADRDSSTIKYLDSLKIEKKLIAKLDEYLSKDRSSRYSKPNQVTPVSNEALEQFRSLKIEQAVGDAKSALKDYEDARERMQAVERNLSAMPSEIIVADAQSAIERCRVERARSEVVVSILDEEIDVVRRKIVKLQQMIDAEAKRLGERLVESEVSNRIVIHSARSRATLAKFQGRLLQENLSHLERTIVDCFRILVRKSRLVSGVSIDPESFQLSILQGTGKVVFAHQLSAGERQLLAVATLWALARASGRHLPAVIDTPLSRLDSKHRESLVRDYFPKASHQVILLSTDEEVVGNYHAMLKPFIAREYLIEHDEDEKTSRIIPGYFEGHDRKAAA